MKISNRRHPFVLIMGIYIIFCAGIIHAADEESLIQEPLNEFEKYECLESEQSPLLDVVKFNYQNVLYSTCVSKEFTEYPAKIARQAFAAMVARLNEPQTYKCLADSRAAFTSPLDIYLVKKVQQGVGERVRGTSVTNSRVFLSPLEGNVTHYADAYLNFFQDPKLMSKGKGHRQYISIGVDAKTLGSSSVPFGSNINYWASLLTLTFLKNMGVSEADKALPGSWPYELSRCVFWSGKIPASQTLPPQVKP